MEFTVDDLKRILRKSAGVQDGIDLDGEILDRPFDEMGYESLALLETGLGIEREFGIQLDDAVLTEAETPRALVAAVNEHLAATADV
jgi:minimal PKS acyl carrier protein